MIFICILIKNDAYDKTEIIKSVRVDNFQIEAKNKDNVQLYKPDAKEENIIFQYNDEDIIQKSGIYRRCEIRFKKFKKFQIKVV